MNGRPNAWTDPGEHALFPCWTRIGAGSVMRLVGRRTAYAATGGNFLCVDGPHRVLLCPGDSRSEKYLRGSPNRYEDRGNSRLGWLRASDVPLRGGTAEALSTRLPGSTAKPVALEARAYLHLPRLHSRTGGVDQAERQGLQAGCRQRPVGVSVCDRTPAAGRASALGL